jgi:DNA modification methylase
MRLIELENHYTHDTISSGIKQLHNEGIICNENKDKIEIRFDVVDIEKVSKYENLLCFDFIKAVRKIKSFSTSNGKYVFSSYNKDRKIINRKENKKKRLGYEYYQTHFDNKNIEIDDSIVNKIHCFDSLEFLKSMPDNCVDLIFTSPPYNFGIAYNSTDDTGKWNDYFQKLFAIFIECIRVLKDGGRIIVNIQPMFSDYIPSHHMISNFFFQQGLIWKGEILWEKNNYNCKYCTWGSWKSPSSPYLKYSWEFIEIFCKNTIKKQGEKDDIDIQAEEFKQWVYAKWSIAPERKMKQFEHDAMFPEELAKRVVKLFSYKNDIILDPFNGAGTTTKVAKELGRRYIGIDIDKTYCETANKRLDTIL